MTMIQKVDGRKLHGLYKKLRNAFQRQGMTRNEAGAAAWKQAKQSLCEEQAKGSLGCAP